MRDVFLPPSDSSVEAALCKCHFCSQNAIPYDSERGAMGQDSDIWDGSAMKGLKEGGYFADERTVPLHFSTEGVQLYRKSTQEVWPFLVLNLNLPPAERYSLSLSAF